MEDVTCSIVLGEQLNGPVDPWVHPDLLTKKLGLALHLKVKGSWGSLLAWEGGCGPGEGTICWEEGKGGERAGLVTAWGPGSRGCHSPGGSTLDHRRPTIPGSPGRWGPGPRQPVEL